MSLELQDFFSFMKSIFIDWMKYYDRVQYVGIYIFSL